MKVFRLLAVAAPLACIAAAALSQTEATPTEQPSKALTVNELLNVGFEVKAMSFATPSVVLVLQRGTAAYVCEADQKGVTRTCVRLK